MAYASVAHLRINGAFASQKMAERAVKRIGIATPIYGTQSVAHRTVGNARPHVRRFVSSLHVHGDPI
jgi:hypothetical protein